MYDYEGTEILTAYSSDGIAVNQAYDINGNPLIDASGLVVMTYNVGRFQGINAQQNLQNRIIDLYKPDIIGMQELGASTLPTVGVNMLSEYQVKQLSDHTNKIMVVTKNKSLSNLVIADFENQDPLDQSYYGETRAYMKADISVGGKTVTWINAHLCYHTVSVKYAQMAELFDMAEQCDYVVLTGDFNSTAMTESSNEYINMYKPFVDAGYHLANNSPIAGFHNTWGDATAPTSLSDLSWACDSIITSSNINIDSVIFDPTKLDYLNGNQIDHIPVVARLTVN